MTPVAARASYSGAVPPPPRPVPRPRPTGRLATAVGRRLTEVVAGAGCGKTTLLAEWAAGRHCAWHTVTAADRDPITFARGLLADLAARVPGLPEELGPALAGMRGPDTPADDLLAAFGPALAAALHAGLRTDLVLVLDDLHELEGAPAAQRCVADLCALAPPRLHLVLSSRAELPFATDRLRQEGQVLRLSADDLAFDATEAAALLAAADLPTGLAPRVVALTGGWAAAVGLLVETLATADDPPATLERFTASNLAADLVAEVLEREVLPRSPVDLSALLRVAAAVDDFTPELVADLGVPEADEAVAVARRRGCVVLAETAPGRLRVTPIVREAVRRRLLDAAELARVRRAAAAWHEARGQTATALRYLTLAGDGPALAAALERHGSALLAAGESAVVLTALAAVPDDDRGPALDLVEGEACQVRGDWERAVACLSRLVPPQGPAPAAAAWRVGVIHHLRGEPTRALDHYRRGLADRDAAPRDLALCGAWGAAAAWLLGDVARSRELVAAAQRAAERAGDHAAWAAVHTAHALVAALDGDRRANDRHYLRALDHARRAGDVLAQIRIEVNRGSRLLEEGHYVEAIAELDTAITLADLAGFAALRTLALVNRGVAARWLGRLEEAERDLTAALTEARRLDSSVAGYALSGLGDVHFDQGNLAQAAACYEQAVALLEPTGDLQGLVPTWSGLAVLRAEDDLAAARELAARAVRGQATLGHTRALLAAGWVALARGEREDARRYADQAAATADEQRDRAGAAEAEELRAAAEPDPQAAVAVLRRVVRRWEELGCPVPRARARLALARRLGGPEAVAICDEVERECRERGARRLVAQAQALRSELARTAPDVSVQTLGGFRVERRGLATGEARWPSRDAQRLLKRLVAARGATVTWPVLGPMADAVDDARRALDPHAEHPPDHYLVAEPFGLRLATERVQVDVNAFLAQAAAALATEGPARLEALLAAEAIYTGDFCAEDLDAPWAIPLREEARATYVTLTRAIADQYSAQGDHDAAVRYLLRLLSCDPYNGPAHLALVQELDGAGRYGDSRRIYRDYAGRMDELGAEPEPYPLPHGAPN